MFYLFRCTGHCIGTLLKNQANTIDTIGTFGDNMREYIEYVAQTRAPRGLLGAIKQAIVNWRLRKDLALLLKFSDYQLRDIGLTRHDLNWLMAQPRGCDLRWEIGQLSADPDAAIDLAGAEPQSGTPNRDAKWKSESPA